jgi:uncharacterized protein
MSAGFLDRVRFRELAERGVRISGSVPLSACARLRDLVEPEPAEIVASLALARQESGIALVRGEVDASLAMRCQRCLDAVALSVKAQMKLAVVENETQLVPDDFEMYVCVDGAGRLADLVEEEILLALPDYPTHATLEECGELARSLLEPARAPREGSPFDVLRNLKKDRDT